MRRRVFGYIYDEYNPSVLFGIRRIVGRPGRCGCFFYEKRRSLEKEDIFCNEDYRIDFSEDEAKKILLENEINIIIDLNDGTQTAVAWGCDLTYDYVKINGDYRT